MKRLSSTRRRLAPIPPILISSRACVMVSVPVRGRLSLHLFGCPHDRLHDVLVSRAAAQVARERPPDLVFCWVWVLVEQGLGCQHHSRRTEPALQTVLF